MSSKTTYALAALPHRSIKDTKVINLRVTTNRKPRYKSLKINIKAKNWDQKKQRVKGGQRGEPNADVINEKIQQILLNAQAQESIHIGKKENDFVHIAFEIIRSTHSTGTRNNRERAIKKLQQYLKHKGWNNLPFRKLDNIFIEGYYQWLLNHGNLRASTANEYMQIISQVIDKIVQSGKYSFRVHPFINYQRKKTENLLEVLDETDLKKLMSFSPKTDKQKLALHIFFFMMHLSGIRISDALTLTFGNFYIDGKGRFMVRYKAQKSGKIITTKISVEAALEMSYFLSGYGQEDKIFLLRKTKGEVVEINNQLKVNKQEMDSIYPSTLTSIKTYFDEEPDEKKQQYLLDREVKKEKRKEYLRMQIVFGEEERQRLKQKLLDIVADIILAIKKERPLDTLIPFMRGIYKGEDKMNDEVEALCNSFKVKNNQALKRIGKKAGIKKKITNHQARHVFAMTLFLRGVNMHHISLALGHSNIATTDRYRQKLLDDTVHDITDEFSETIREL